MFLSPVVLKLRFMHNKPLYEVSSSEGAFIPSKGNFVCVYHKAGFVHRVGCSMIFGFGNKDTRIVNQPLAHGTVKMQFIYLSTRNSHVTR